MEDVVSAWALKETEESVPGGADIPGDENSKSEGTETGKPAPLPGMTMGAGRKGRTGLVGRSVMSA